MTHQEDFTRLPPHSIEAEESAIGSVMIDPSVLGAVTFLTMGDFYIVKHGWTWDVLLTLAERGDPIDPLTVCNELEARGQLAEAGGAAFVNHLINVVPTAIHAEGYGRIIQRAAWRRNLLKAASDLAQVAYDETGDPFETCEKIYDLALPPGVSALPITWAGEALKPQPPVDWIVNPIGCAGSVGCIAGEGGCGKTYTMLDLGVAIANGEKTWLNFDITSGVVLVIDEESGDRRMKRRLGEVMRGHGAGPDLTLAYITLAGLNLRDNAQDIAALRAVILKTKPRLVIIDALIDVMAGGDDSAAQDVHPVFQALRKIADEAQCFIIVIHHYNRSGSFRGSSAIQGAVDVLLGMERLGEGGPVKIESVKTRDAEPFKFSARMNFGEGIFNLSPCNTEDAKMEHFSRSESYVMRYLESHGATSKSDIMAHADTCSDNAARLAIYSLVKRGKVERTDSGGPGKQAIFALPGIPVAFVGVSFLSGPRMVIEE